MAIKKTLKIFSFGLLFYLLADSIMQVDFAGSKNEAFTAMQKAKVDTIQNIDTVKHKAKAYLDRIRLVRRNYSDEAVIKFWLLAGLITIQVFLFSTQQSKSSSENKSK